MADSTRDRESELMTYLRNNISDPSSRGTQAIEYFNGTGSTYTYTLANTLVKNIVAVEVSGSAKYMGYDYSVSYGEGSSSTTITMVVAPPLGANVLKVTYRYGSVMIYEGYQRLDSELPRLSVIFSSARDLPMSIGEQKDGSTGRWIYKDSTYIIEVRSRYAKQMKDLVNTTDNALNAYRQQTPQPYKTVMLTVNSVETFDFDNELRLYRGQIRFTVRWLHKFM